MPPGGKTKSKMALTLTNWPAEYMGSSTYYKVYGVQNALLIVVENGHFKSNIPPPSIRGGDLRLQLGVGITIISD